MKPTKASVDRAHRILALCLPEMHTHDDAINNLYFLNPDTDSTRLPSIAAALYIIREDRDEQASVEKQIITLLNEIRDRD